MSNKETETFIQAALRDFLNSELRGSNLYRHYTEKSCIGLVRYTICDNKYNSNKNRYSKQNKNEETNFIRRETRSVRRMANMPRYETRSITKQNLKK